MRSWLKIRTLTRHQREQADRFHVEVIDMRAWESGFVRSLARARGVSVRR
jgi:hypothetical protein